MAFGLQRQNATDTRESLLSILRDVSPNTDNYFVTNLGTSAPATNTIHEWVTYNTARPTSITGTVEGADASYDDLTTPVRTNNVTGILSRTVKVSGTMRKVATATNEDPMTFQKDEALKLLKGDMEFATVNGVYASAGSGNARTMAGFAKMISTNVTARASGQSFTETELNDIMNDVWTSVGAMYVADLIVCPMVISRRISGFTSNLTRNIDAKEKRLTNQIRVYDSQVGQTVKIIPHKDVNAAAGTVTVFALREDTWKYSFLREPFWQENAKLGDYENGQYLTEFTLVGFAQRASARRTGYATTL